jgi:hypothetical protein
MKTNIKTLLVSIALTLVSNSAFAVSVDGYFKKNGTYVKPHYRTQPDGNEYNNYSYQRQQLQRQERNTYNSNPYGYQQPSNNGLYQPKVYGRGY